MSVTFSATMSNLVGWDVECVCGATFLSEGEQPMTRDQVETLLYSFRDNPRGLENCKDDDCYYYGIYSKAITEGPESDSVNVANGNSVPIFEALGLMHEGVTFEDVCAGSMPAEDFLGRILMHMAVAPVSAEKPTLVNQGARGAKEIVCGRPEGYVQDQLARLQAIAEFAVAQGRDIMWS